MKDEELEELFRRSWSPKMPAGLHERVLRVVCVVCQDASSRWTGWARLRSIGSGVLNPWRLVSGRSRIAKALVVATVGLAGIAGAVCLAGWQTDLERGKQLLSERKHDEAITVLRTVVAGDATKDAASVCDGWYSLGLCYRGKKDWESAIECYRRVISIPECPEPLKRDARHRLAESYHDVGKLPQAISVYEATAAEYPDQAAQAYLLAGNSYRELKRYAEAILTFKKALESSPDTSTSKQLMWRLASCYHANGNWDEAMAMYHSILREYPDQAVRAQLLVGICYQDQKKYAEAIEALKRTIETTPKDDRSMRELRGRFEECCRAAGDWDTMIALYDKLGKDDAKDALHAKFLAAEWLRQQKRYAEALAALQDALKLAPASSAAEDIKEIKSCMALCYRENREWKKAISCYADLAREYPADAGRYRMEIGGCWQAQGDYDSAASVYRQLAADLPNTPQAQEALFQVAEILHLKGRFADELSCLDDLARKYPEARPQALARRAYLLSVDVKDYGAARATVEQITSELPDHPLSVEQLWAIVNTLEQRGELERAEEILRASITNKTAPEARAARMNWIGNVYLRARKYDEAVRSFSDELRVVGAPADAQARARYYLGLCCRKMGRTASARSYMRSVSRLWPGSTWADAADNALKAWEYLDTHPSLIRGKG